MFFSMTVHEISYDTTMMLNTLRQPLVADSLEASQMGVASVLNHTLVGAPLRIPVDYKYCGKSWYAPCYLNHTAKYFDAIVHTT